jgi:16S rRNA (cytosine1402-N4)-methyltransferase
MSVMLGTMTTRRPSRARRRPLPRAADRRVAGTHQPVLLEELLAALAPRPGEVAVDATLGGGGVAASLLQSILPGGRVLALDRDPVAVAAAKLRFAAEGAFTARVGRFSDLVAIAAEAGIVPDLVVMDLGISSLQLDDPRRGFSFQVEGPLDMRLDPAGGGPTAAEIVATHAEEQLARLLSDLGQERHSRAIARAIVARRRDPAISTTTQLAEVCAGAIPRRLWPPHIHPATRTFLALRIAVNQELDELRGGISAAIQILRPGGRLGIISFHSLEDTIAKRSLHDLALACVCPPQQPICTCAHRATLSLPQRRAIKPSAAEVARNPRARSALLRWAVKLPTPTP